MCTGNAAVMHGSVKSVENSAAASYGPGGKLLLPILSMAPQLVLFIKQRGCKLLPSQGLLERGKPDPLLPYASSLREDWGSVYVTSVTSNI